MKKQLLFFVLVIWTIISLVRCDDATIIGGELLNDESINLLFTDTTTIHTSTEVGKPVNSGRVAARTFMIGVLDDPIFGKTTSDLYFGIEVLDGGPIFTGRVLDSIALSIAFDTAGFYGLSNALYDFELFITTEGLKEDTTYSDEILLIESLPLTTEIGKRISPEDSVFIIDTALDTLVAEAPHFRLSIDSTFSAEFYDMIKTVTDDQSLLEIVPALYLKGTPDISAIAGFNLGSSERLGDFNKLTLYLKDSLGVKSTYDFRFRIDRFSHFEHDYSGAPVEQFIDGTLPGDSLFFVQGMAGLDGVIDISSVLQYEDFLINKVELELTVAEDSEFDLDDYPPIQLYGASYEGEDGNLVSIEDFDLIADFGFGVFGGQLEQEEVNGETIKKVKINITNHVVNYIKDPSIGGKIRLSPFFESEIPNRTVFYGAGHSKYPAKLNIALTQP